MGAGAETVRPPSSMYLLLEGRALAELGWTKAVMPWLRQAPPGDGHPVKVFPGFIASDYSTRPLRRFLGDLGYRARPWGFGRNLGPRGDLETRMVDRVRYLHRVYGRKVSLVGWSLGGIFAREVARQAPEAVRQVISLGSPFGHPKANHSWRLFERLSGMRIDELDEERLRTLRETPPVPTTAIYSRTDGIAHWRSCVERKGPNSESIEVLGSHCGLGCNPSVLYAIADRLALPEDGWRPFDRTGWRRVLFPRPHRPRA